MRAYEIKPNSEPAVFRLMAKISAGKPAAVDSLLERVDLNEFLTGGADSSLLIEIEGDSMEDVPIFDGDWVMLDRVKKPESGSIVIACLNGEYTIKRHKLNDDSGRRGLYLVPANISLKPIQITPKDDYEILGVVTFIIHPTK